MKNIVLIGMPAVGKSTVGVVVAKRLGYEFVDTDLLIQKQEKRLLKEIIAQEGNDGFLAIENQVNRDLDVENAVIAPGGSVVYCEEAMEHYKKTGTVVYLKVSYETIDRKNPKCEKPWSCLERRADFKRIYNEERVLPNSKKYADYTILRGRINN